MSRQITWDSEYRQKQSDSVGDFNIRTPSDIREIRKLTILDAIVPFTFYVFDGSNNNFTIDQGGPQILSVGVGNYTANELALAMETAINLVYSGFSVTYSSTTGKFQISDATIFTLSFPADNNLAKYIGFDSSLTYSGSTSYTGGNRVLPNGDNYLFIRSHQLTSGATNRPYTENKPSDALIKLPLFPNPDGVLFYLPFMEITLDYRGGKSINDVDFKLTDKYGKTLDLNGHNWSLTCLIEEIR